jgi:murein DD-endopeptidase MepM/ murein hydrolase activator NlpD
MTKRIIKILVNEIKRLRMNNKKDISWKNLLCLIFVGIIIILTICLFSLSNQDKQTLISFQEKSRNEKQLLINAMGIGGGDLKDTFTERDVTKKVEFLMMNYNLTKWNMTFNFLGYPFSKPEEAYLIDPKSQFCYRKEDGYFHKGTDISSFADYNIRSVYYGRVRHVIQHDIDYGNYIIISQFIEGYEYQFLYAHLTEIYVKKNEVVKKGQRIGLMGMEGKGSSGNHLHFEIKRLEKNGWKYYNYFSQNLFGKKYYLSYP